MYMKVPLRDAKKEFKISHAPKTRITHICVNEDPGPTGCPNSELEESLSGGDAFSYVIATGESVKY
jgi:hypothetical protein